MKSSSTNAVFSSSQSTMIAEVLLTTPTNNITQTNRVYNLLESSLAIPPTSIFAFLVLLSLIFMLGIVFNIISISSIISARAFTPINILIINLSVADIIYSFGIPLFVAQSFMFRWPFDEVGCRLFLFTDFIGIIVSIFTVTLLSVERFFDVADEKKRLDYFSNKFKVFITLVCVFLIWLIAILFTLPMVVSIRMNENGITCDSTWSDFSLKTYFLIKFLFIFLFPYMLILISSSKLLIFLNKWRNNMTGSTSFRGTSINDSSSFVQSSSNRRRSTLKTRSSSKTSKFLDPRYSVSNTLYKNSSISGSSQLPELSLNDEYKLSSTYKSSNLIDEYSYVIYQVPIDELDHDSDSDDKECTVDDCCLCKNIVDCFKFLNYIFGFSDCCNRSKDTGYTSGSYINSVRRKASRLVLIIILLFLIQWSPLWIFQLFVMFSEEEIENIQIINLIISTLSYSNTVANPALYMLLTYNFREYCKKGFLKIPLSRFFAMEKQISCPDLNKIDQQVPIINSNILINDKKNIHRLSRSLSNVDLHADVKPNKSQDSLQV